LGLHHTVRYADEDARTSYDHGIEDILELDEAIGEAMGEDDGEDFDFDGNLDQYLTRVVDGTVNP